MNKKKSLIVFIIIFALIVSLFSGLQIANAFDGYGQGRSLTELYNATNTYEGATITSSTNTNYDENNQFSVSYNMSQKKDKPVMDSPQITILTHGVGSAASAWSNDFDLNLSYDDNNASRSYVHFAYDKDSLINKISQEAGGANIYWAIMNKDKINFYLYDITNKQYNTNNLINTITDISKHIIIVYQASNSSVSNNNAYYEFNNMLSKVVYDVKVLNDGILPKVNLVGHSRGGLTNMQYALDHPDLVASIVSIGSPYFASTTARLDYLADIIFGSSIGGGSDGIKDIINPNKYYDYNTTWNNNYSTKYSNINVTAIGGYSTIAFLGEMVDYDRGGTITEGNIDLIKKVISLIDFLVSSGLNIGYKAMDILLKDLIPGVNSDLYEIFGNELTRDIYYPFTVFKNDCLVSLNSQLGKDEGNMLYTGSGDYQGFKNERKCFNILDGTKFDKVSKAEVPVVHNLEARDAEIISWVVNSLDFGISTNNGFISEEKEDGTLIIKGYRGVFDSPNLVVPSTINGNTVTEIDENAFCGNFITSLTIPASVTKIGLMAFANCSALTSITFESSTANPNKLNELEYGVFLGCSSLQSLILPINVKSVGNYVFANCSSMISLTLNAGLESIGAFAFMNCTALTSITLPKNLQTLGDIAFLNCSSVETISINSTNSNFTTYNNTLYNKDKTILLYYPANSVNTSLSLPYSVKTVSNYAFYGNKTISSINLNNVTSLKEGAFFECNNLSSISANKVKSMGNNALTGTAWLSNNTNQYKSMGNVLISYSGSDTSIDLSIYEYIHSFAFAYNTNLNKVSFGNNTINIGSYAFLGCKELNEVFINNVNNIVYIGTNTFKDNALGRKIYVAQPLFSEYQNNDLWQQYITDVNVHQSEVSFNSLGGTEFQKINISYYDNYSLPIPTKTGYYFEGWYTNIQNGVATGDKFDTTTPWTNLEDAVTIYAKWSPIEYSVIYYANGGTVNADSIKYTIEDTITYSIPSKTGYTFDGWYNDVSLTEYAGTGFSAGIYGNKNLYAKWSANTYNITFDLNDGSLTPAELGEGTNTVIFDSSFTLPIATRKYYIFNGWQDINGEFYTISNGSSCQTWDKAEDTTLYADWTKSAYVIKVDANGHIFWANEYETFNGTETGIPYGTEFVSIDELNNNFNPEKISYKEGHKFAYFTSEKNKAETRITSLNSYINNLAENEVTVSIYAFYEKEINFVISFKDVVSPNINYVQAKFGSSILFPTATKYGYFYSGRWLISVEKDVNTGLLINNKFVDTKFAPGTVFNCTSMPDLSIDVEEDGTLIRLEPDWQPVSTSISFFTNYVSKPSSKTIKYDEILTLPVLPTCPGRTFNGWYSGQNGTGTKYSGTDGNMIKAWDKISSTSLYAYWTVINYDIEYVLNGGINDSRNPTSYNIDSTTKTLNDAYKADSRFMGWFDNANFTGLKIGEIPQGSTDNKIFYAKFKKIYGVSFSTPDGTSCATETGIEGETITLPYSNRTRYNGTWQSWGYLTEDANVSNFGHSYTIGNTDVILSVVWKGYEYNITYCNLDDPFNKYEGFLNHDVHSASLYNRLSTYEYGKGQDLNSTYARFPQRYTSDYKVLSTPYLFLGWYTDMNFTTRVTSINSKVFGDVDLFAKWEMYEDLNIRFEKYLITDSGRLNQSFDEFYIGINNNYNKLINMGFNYLVIDLKLRIWEKYDGYQGILLYKKYDSNSNTIWETELETNSTPTYYAFNISLKLDDIKDMEYLYILFGARGAFADDWYNDNLTIYFKFKA
jgi:uncharacterized repeat protein (TIGR02543 family)